MSKVLQEYERAQLKEELPKFRVGDTVDVHVRIIEGDNFEKKIEQLTTRPRPEAAE